MAKYKVMAIVALAVLAMFASSLIAIPMWVAVGILIRDWWNDLRPLIVDTAWPWIRSKIGLG